MARPTRQQILFGKCVCRHAGWVHDTAGGACIPSTGACDCSHFVQREEVLAN
jgi:hypothetical protein